MGLRQLRHPVQGVRLSPGAPRTVEEKIADAATGAPLHRPRPAGRPAHPVGPGRRLRQARAATPRTSASALGHDQLQHLPGRRLQARQPHPRRRAGSGRRRSTTTLECIDIMDATGVARPEDLAGRRHQLPGPGRPARPAGPARRVAGARSTTGSATTSGWCSSTSSSSRRSTTPTCRTGARRTPTCVALGERAVVCLDTGHHAPGTNIEFIVAQLLRLGKLGSFDFNSPLLRRRRPDRRARPTRSSCSGSCSRSSAAAATTPGERGRLHARPVPQHRGARSPARSARCSTSRR